ncbi:MAG: DNA repair protein RecO C-terminal domain-containing protein, partial [Prevotella sp.]|nr:DNA repair protein RecO C-terminal domain-containing protein [Prevotella sp.]
RPKVQLQKIRNVALFHPYSSLPFDIDKLTVGLFISEFLYHSLYGEQANEPMFDYIYDSLQWFDGSPSPTANFHLVFMMRLSLFLGFYPNLDDYASGCVFDLRSGSFSSVAPLHSDYLLPDEASQMSLMMRMNYSTMHLFKFTRAQRNRLLDIIVQYYRLHIPGFPDMKSLDVLRNIYD